MLRSHQQKGYQLDWEQGALIGGQAPASEYQALILKPKLSCAIPGRFWHDLHAVLMTSTSYLNPGLEQVRRACLGKSAFVSLSSSSLVPL